MTAIRSSPFAGTWYPKERSLLADKIESLLDAAPSGDAPGRLLALVSPHAALQYSGPVAAAGYRLLRGLDFDTVLLLGPSHRVFFDALAVYPRGAFETPFGDVPIDEELSAALIEAAPEMRPMPEVHVREHSLDVQLPFLRHLLPAGRIAPVMMGNQSEELVRAASRAIREAVSRLDRNVLLVASSDLSHYHSRLEARELDGQVLKHLEHLDAEGLQRLLLANDQHACGGGPMIAVMQAASALGASRSKILGYGDSGDVTGDTDGVVGYVSAAFFDPDEAR